jgi:hypothetical protein
VSRPTCASCGLIAEASTPTVNPLTGEIEYACKYIIDPYIAEQVSVVEQHVDVAKMRDENGQIKLPGIPAYLCSTFCLMQELFCYGRCAGCAKKLPRKKLLRDWHLVKDGVGKSQYAKFDYCSPECKQRYSAREGIWSARHVLQTLATFGIKVSMPAEFTAKESMRGRCANKNCGQGRDSRGNRVRAKVPERGDFCSSACKRAQAEVSARAVSAASAKNTHFYAHILKKNQADDHGTSQRSPAAQSDENRGN